MVYPKNCLVIDIGNEQIKIADLTRGGGVAKISQFAMIATPENCINDGVILDKVSLNNVIRPVLKGGKFKNKNLIFTISSTKIITREVDFPDIKSKKVRTIILNSASEYFPVNLNDYILDYVVTDSVVIEGQKTLKINMIAALASLIEEYVALADLLDVKLAGIDYTGNSLTNFLKKEKFEGTSMVLDIGSESTMVSIMTEGVSRFNRNLMYGTGLLLDCIMNHFEVDANEAVRISRERPLLSIEQDDSPYLSNDVSSAMNQILNGVSRLVDYYASRNTEKITRVYIVGGGGNINGIEEYIEKFFNIPAKVIKNFKSATYKGLQDFSSVEVYFANVIGATFSEVNLLPKNLAEKEAVNSRKRTAFLLVILVAVMLIAIYIMEQGKIVNLQNKKNQLEIDIAGAKEAQEIKIELDTVTNRVNFRQALLEASKSSSEQFISVLELMEEQMPTDVFYLGMVDTGESIEINCIAKDKMTVAKFIEALKGMDFSEVYVPGITETDSEGGNTYVSFSISCKY